MKNKNLFINSLKDIMHKYSTYLIDVAGVIYDGKEPFTSAIEIINFLLHQQKQIIFLSNNPRPNSYIRKNLKTFGIIGDYRIITSGDLLHHTLATTLRGKKIYHLGRNHEHTLLEGINISLTSSPFDSDAIIVSCFVEGNEDHNLFDTDLHNIIAADKPIYCPNPDQLALEGSLLRYPSGYFAHKITQHGGSVIYLGKPSRIIYDFITYMHPDITIIKKTALMIGDTLETDICGAINFGIDSLLVLNGVTGLITQNNIPTILKSPHQPTYIIKELL